jgi:hypothetical protein
MKTKVRQASLRENYYKLTNIEKPTGIEHPDAQIEAMRASTPAVSHPRYGHKTLDLEI